MTLLVVFFAGMVLGVAAGYGVCWLRAADARDVLVARERRLTERAAVDRALHMDDLEVARRMLKQIGDGL